MNAGTSSFLRTSVQPFSSFLRASVLPSTASTLPSFQPPTFVRFLIFLYWVLSLSYFSHCWMPILKRPYLSSSLLISSVAVELILCLGGVIISGFFEERCRTWLRTHASPNLHTEQWVNVLARVALYFVASLNFGLYVNSCVDYVLTCFIHIVCFLSFSSVMWYSRETVIMIAKPRNFFL